MGHELICSWLGLSSDHWPPDHYRLLGLEPGAADRARIEHHVHQRLETVRRYQLLHPEEATEALNRLAQAFICLTDAAAKRSYDATLGSTLAEPAQAAAETMPQAAAAQDPLAWLYGPWNQRVVGETAANQALTQTRLDLVPAPAPDRPLARTDIPTAPPEVPVATPMATEQAQGNGQAPLATVVTSPAPAAERIDPVLEAAQHSAPARRGLGTKRAFYYRIARTRQLLRAWELAGIYLNRPARPLNRSAEASALIRQLNTIRDLLRGFPPLLGEAGQPGYLVVALAQQPMVVPTFQTLLLSQRQALARDWQTGHKLLTAHRQFLRRELAGMRKKGTWHWAVRAVRALIADQPAALLVLLAFLILSIVLWRNYVDDWLRPHRVRTPDAPGEKGRR